VSRAELEQRIHNGSGFSLSRMENHAQVDCQDNDDRRNPHPAFACQSAERGFQRARSNFAQTIEGCTSFEPANVAKPQSEPAMTFSRPTTPA